MSKRQITVGHLYPNVMSTRGDRGNVAAIVRRCRWRDIDVNVTELQLGDTVAPGEIDLIMIGGGGERRQRQVAADLYKIKGGGIRDAVAAGAAALAVAGGFELFGRFCQPEKGPELRGIELFDSWTIRRCGDLRDPDGARHDAILVMPDDATTAVQTIAVQTTADRTCADRNCADKAVGDLVVRWGASLLIGFEDRHGRTYLGAEATPLGRVESGRGNNGDGTEGVLHGSAVGTNMRGPCLPANPALADFLIAAALRRRYGDGELPPLTDDLELAARNAAMQRRVITARRRGLSWPRHRLSVRRRAGART